MTTFNSSRQVREQSLNRRAASTAAAEEVGAAGKKAWGPAFKKYGKEFLIGTGATMAFAYAFEKLNGSGSSKESSTPSTPSVTPDGSSAPPSTANTGNDPNSQGYPTNPTSTNPNYSTSTSPTDATTTDPNYSTSTSPADATTTDPNYSTSTGPTDATTTDPYYSTTQTQNGYQQRAVDRDLHADIFGEPHLESWFTDSMADGIVIICGSSEARSPSDNYNQNRQGEN